MNRYPGLDLLRAVAILWVLLFHGWTEGLGAPVLSICTSGWMAVDLFFVLSGYLIGAQLFAAFGRGDVAPIKTFYVRRLLRILPTYLLIVAAYEWLPFARERSGLAPAWQFLTFTENFLIDYKHNQALSHAWSLCVEEHFYWLLPLLVSAILPQRSWKLVAAVCTAIFFGGVVYRWIAWSEVLQDGAILHTDPYKFIEWIYYPTVARTDGLLAGVCLAMCKAFRPKIWNRAMRHPYALLFAACMVLTLAILISSPRTTFAAAVFGFPLLALGFALLVGAAASENGVLGRFKVPGAQFLATITFSLYLSHKMTWHLLRKYLPALVPSGTVQAFTVYAITALSVGALLYFLVEHTFLRLRSSRQKSLLSQAAGSVPTTSIASSCGHQ